MILFEWYSVSDVVWTTCAKVSCSDWDNVIAFSRAFGTAARSSAYAHIVWSELLLTPLQYSIDLIRRWCSTGLYGKGVIQHFGDVVYILICVIICSLEPITHDLHTAFAVQHQWRFNEELEWKDCALKMIRLIVILHDAISITNYDTWSYLPDHRTVSAMLIGVSHHWDITIHCIATVTLPPCSQYRYQFVG